VAEQTAKNPFSGRVRIESSDGIFYNTRVTDLDSGANIPFVYAYEFRLGGDSHTGNKVTLTCIAAVDVVAEASFRLLCPGCFQDALDSHFMETVSPDWPLCLICNRPIVPPHHRDCICNSCHQARAEQDAQGADMYTWDDLQQAMIVYDKVRSKRQADILAQEYLAPIDGELLAEEGNP